MYKKQKQYFFKRRHNAIIDADDVIAAIKILSTYTRIPNEKIFIRNAGWEHKPDRYFIAFAAYNREWDKINKDLCAKIPNIEILR